MARLRFSTFLLLPLLALTGCSEFFGFNVFSALDTVAAPSVSKYEGSGGLALLADDLSSPAVVAALTADTTGKVADIENYLYTSYTLGSGTLATPDQKQAAILYGDLNLKTTEGENLVNNIVTTVMSGDTSGKSIHDLLAAVLPASALSDPAVFSSMIVALYKANGPYVSLGASLDANSDGVTTGEGVPAGTNMGDVAQKSAVAWTITFVYKGLQDILGTSTQSTIVDQMYLLCADPGSANASAVAWTPDPFEDPSTDSHSTAKSYSNTNLSSIVDIFHCAGLQFPPQ